MLIKIAFKNLLNKKSRTITLMVSVMIGMTFLLLFLGLTENIKNIVSKQIEEKTSLNEIRVTAPATQIGIVKLKDLAGISSLNTEKVEQIKNFENVERIIPQINYKNISSIEIEIFGSYLQSDALLFGMPLEAIDSSIKDPNDWKYDGNYYPVILSKRLLDLYNYTLAEGNNLPLLKEEDIIGKQLYIFKDHSSFLPFLGEKTEAIPAKIIGFSEKANLLGLTMPFEVVQQWNEERNGEQLNEFMAVYVEVNNPDNIPDVAKEIEKLGLNTSYVQKEIKGIDVQFRLIGFLIFIIPLAVLIIAGLSIFNIFMASINERKKEIGILRTFGATKMNIYSIFFIEAGIIGFISGITAIILSKILELMVNQIFLSSFEFVSIKPETLILINPTLSLGVLFFAILFCIGASFTPANKAANLDPVKSFK